MRNNHAQANKSRLCRSRCTRHTAAATICLFGPSASRPSGVSEDGVGDTKTWLLSYRRASRAQCASRRARLTVEDLDGDGLLLLDGLRVREAGVADVVVPGVLAKHVGEVKVSVQRLGHPVALGQPLEVWCGDTPWQQWDLTGHLRLRWSFLNYSPGSICRETFHMKPICAISACDVAYVCGEVYCCPSRRQSGEESQREVDMATPRTRPPEWRLAWSSLWTTKATLEWFETHKKMWN